MFLQQPWDQLEQDRIDVLSGCTFIVLIVIYSISVDLF